MLPEGHNCEREYQDTGTKRMRVYAYVDSIYATNKDNRKSVSGALVTVGGTLVSWMSKNQSSPTLSSTEAEYVALMACGSEVKLVQMMLEELDSTVKRPAVVFEDSTGAIHLVKQPAHGFKNQAQRRPLSFYPRDGGLWPDVCRVCEIREQYGWYHDKERNGEDHNRHNERISDGMLIDALAYALFKNWPCEMMDVEATFLEAGLDEEVFIE
jgi:hypothetical protein